MQDLVIVIIAWLVINFGLPAADEGPRVQFASPAEMAELRRDAGNSTPTRTAVTGQAQSIAGESSEELFAIYDDRDRTIYLPERWTAGSPADVSLLVHELVHHLQNAGGLAYACPEEREKTAYQAQRRWLEIFKLDLLEEFSLDAMTLHLRTRCMY